MDQLGTGITMSTGTGRREQTRPGNEAVATLGGPVLAKGSLGEPLERLASVADALGAERLAAEARELSQRVAEGRFYVACMGEFKRGKSTLVNALLGERLLPAGIVPVTTVPTVVRYGSRRGARVRLSSGRWEEVDLGALEDYVSEERNPENQKGVEVVEVFLPAPILASGMCLVDTPGLGSVFAAGSRATRAFIPHVDVGLVVVGTDPPLTGEELALIETVASQVHTLIVVLNKADRVSSAERDVAVAFAKQVIERRLGRTVDRIYEISAVERLERRGPERDWPALVKTLDGLVRGSDRSIALKAQERGLVRLSGQLLGLLNAEREALLRPLVESERRLAVLSETLAAAEQALEELGMRFTREQQRLSGELVERSQRFLETAIAGARLELGAAVASLQQRWGPRFRRGAMDAAQEVARRWILPWLSEEQSYAETAYRRVERRFVEMANDFLNRLAASGEAELAHLPEALNSDRGLRVGSSFYFHDLLQIAHPASPLRYALDVFLGVLGGRPLIAREADQFLVRLLTSNAARVQNDIEERLGESRRRLEAEIRSLLREVGALAERSLERVRRAKEAGALEVETQLRRLETYREAVEEVLGALRS
jgi:GTP-binding protein EngB required for normal cell division